MSKLTDFQDEARVVYERSHSFHEEHGPHEYGKIGVAFGSTVFWTGSYYFPGTETVSYNAAVGFASEIASRWNAGRAALANGDEGNE